MRSPGDTEPGHFRPEVLLQWHLDRVQRALEDCLERVEMHRAAGRNALAAHYQEQAYELEVEEGKLLAQLPAERVCPRRKLPGQKGASCAS